MKKVSTLICGLAAVLALAGCSSKGKEVSAEEFKEKAQAVEAHEYSGCTIKYDVDWKDSEKTAKESGEVEFTYDSEHGFAPQTETTAVEVVEESFYSSISEALTSIEGQADQYSSYGVDASVKYYVEPFGLELKLKGSFDTQVQVMGITAQVKGSVDVEGYAEFNEYGYLVKLEEKVDIKSDRTYQGSTSSYEASGKVNFTVEYK